MPKAIGKTLFERDQIVTVISEAQTLTGTVKLPMDDYVVIVIEPHEMQVQVDYDTMAFVVSFGHRVEIVLRD